MQTGYKVMDVMTNKPVIADKNLTLRDAAVIMEQQKVNSLLILEEKKPIGLVTDEDFVRKCIGKGLDPKKIRIKDIMITELLTITPEKDIYDALSIMRDNNIRQLPVVKKGVLEGFLTLKDILKLQPDLLDLVMEKYSMDEEKRKNQEDEVANDDGAGGFFSMLKSKKNSLLKKSSKNTKQAFKSK